MSNVEHPGSTEVRVFDSYEEFERELLPNRHVLRRRGSDTAEELASRMAEQSLDRLRVAVRRPLASAAKSGRVSA